MKKIFFFFVSLFIFQIADAQNWNTEIVNGVIISGSGSRITSITKDTSNNIWVANDSGLFKRTGGIWSRITAAPLAPPNYFWSGFYPDVACDNQNRVWWIGNTNLFYFNGTVWQEYLYFTDLVYNSVKTDDDGNAFAIAIDTMLSDPIIIDLQSNTYSTYTFEGVDIIKVKGDSIYIDDNLGTVLVFEISSGNFLTTYSYASGDAGGQLCITPDEKLFGYDNSMDIGINSGAFINVFNFDSGVYSIPLVAHGISSYAYTNYRVKYYDGKIYFLTYHDSTQQQLVIWFYDIQNQTSGEIPITVAAPYQLFYPSFDMVDSEIVVCGYLGTSQMFFVTYDLNSCSANFSMHPDTASAHTWFALNTATGVSPINYEWTWGDGGTSIGPTPSHTFSSPGNYPICLTITDDLGCTSTYCDSSTYLYKLEEGLAMVTVNVVTQLPNGVPYVSAEENNLSINPNPCTLCEISGAENSSDLFITDILGRNVSASFTKSSTRYFINLPEASNGIFLVRNKKTGEVVKFVRE